jgi:hypothetical protein
VDKTRADTEARRAVAEAQAWALEQARAGGGETEATPNTDLDDAIDTLARQRAHEVAHWQVFYRRLWGHGQARGWDIRTLAVNADTRVTTQPGWNTGTAQLVKAGYLHKDQAGTVALVSDADWQAERLWERVPCPPGEPPDIVPPPYARQQTPQETTGKQAAVEGVVVGKG